MRFFKSDMSEIDKLANLAQTTYHSGEIIDVNYLNWEYTANPAGNAIAFLAGDEQMIVSQYVVLPREIICENEKVKSSLSLNTITHPDHRGKGYFIKLAEMTFSECKELGIGLTLGFPNKHSVKGFINKLKFTKIGNLPLMLKVVNPLKAVTSVLRRRKNINEQEIYFDFKLPGVSKLDLNKDLEKYHQFWSEFKKRNLITTDRSPEFLRWRYVDIPIRKYHLYKIESDDKIETVLIFRIKNIFGVRCGIIVDLLSLNKTQVFNQLIREIQKNGPDIFISTVPENSPEWLCLKSSGFFKVPEFLMLKKLDMIIRFHSKNISDSYTDIRKWFITFGDYDIF
ncbi:MAG: GNAT family N-acetyltransferase [Bacteroidota bacterium]